MNIKSKQGLALLDAILADSTWTIHCETFGDIFKGIDVDSFNHLISTEINGEEVIDEYDELLSNEHFIADLDIIQNNINSIFK
jgi:hypothetical protein